ncbi:MAG: hypothetical protein WCN95_08180 [bacterium]
MTSFRDSDVRQTSEAGATGAGDQEKRPWIIGQLLKGLSLMTPREQQAVLIVLLLSLLGIGVKTWHLWRVAGSQAQPASVTMPASVRTNKPQ